MSIISQTISVLLLITCFLGCGLTGCRVNNSTVTTQQEIVRQSEALSKEYLQADVRYAKECLEKDAKLLEGATVLEPSGRAQLLALTYFRLYSLEKRTGNELAAKARLIKARYWRLTKAELAGVKQDEAVNEIEQLTSDRILDEVEQFDRKHNNGSPAKYVLSVKQTATKK